MYVDGLFEQRSSNGATVYNFHIFAEGEVVSGLGDVGLECIIPILGGFCIVASVADPNFEAVNRPAGAVR